MDSRFKNMRVLLVAKPWQGGLAHYLQHALRDVVGEGNVTWYSTRPQSLKDRFIARRSNQHWRALLTQRIEAHSYDAAIFLYPLDIFSALAGRAAKHLCWLVDDATISPGLAHAMGHIFLSDPSYLDALTARVPAAHLAGVLPFAMLPAIHQPSHAQPDARGMCFIASRGGKRDAWLGNMLARRIDCHNYGNYVLRHPLYWRYPRQFHRRVPLTAMGDVYARHLVSLNLHAEIVRGGTNMRSFEAAGYGTPQLIERMPGLEHLLEPEKEVLTFSDIEGLAAQYDRLTKDAELRARLADHARKRVLSEHTYQQRVVTMLERIA